DSAWDDAFNIGMEGDGTYDAIFGMTPAAITYKVADVADVTLNLPSGGSNVNVHRTDKPLKIVGIHTGLYFADDIKVGGGANGMSDIHAPVTTSNPNSIYYVELNDQNDPSARLIQVDSNPVTQMDSVTGMSGGAVQWASGDPVLATLHTSNVGGNGIIVRGIDTNNIVTVSGASPLGGPNDVVTVGDSGSVQR